MAPTETCAEEDFWAKLLQWLTTNWLTLSVAVAALAVVQAWLMSEVRVRIT
jgi:hypothetical protein